MAGKKSKKKDDDRTVVNVSLDADALIEKIGLPALSEYLEDRDKTMQDLIVRVERLERSDEKKIAKQVTDFLIWKNFSDL